MGSTALGGVGRKDKENKRGGLERDERYFTLALFNDAWERKRDRGRERKERGRKALVGRTKENSNREKD